jgi:peptidoglycan hydrolase-like protein with peptidoglycan-binding domain
MKENKTLSYILFGLPLLVAAYFGYKAIKKAQEGKDKKDETDDTKTDTKTEPKTESGGGTSGGGTSSVSDALPFKRGKTSSHNIEIQTKLQKLGFFPAKTAFSKNFGSATEKAVLDFQEKNKGTLGKPDGVVGKNTWKLLFDGNEFPKTDGVVAATKPDPIATAVVTPKMSNEAQNRLNSFTKIFKGHLRVNDEIKNKAEWNDIVTNKVLVKKITITSPRGGLAFYKKNGDQVYLGQDKTLVLTESPFLAQYMKDYYYAVIKDNNNDTYIFDTTQIDIKFD